MRQQVVARNCLSAANETALRREEHLLRGIDHPNVMKLHEFYESPSHFYMVSELFEGGELFDRICSKVTSRMNLRALVHSVSQGCQHNIELGLQPLFYCIKPETI